MIEKRWIVYSSRISGWETGLTMLMEHIFSFQYELYWKKHDLKNALKKEIFLTKIFDTLCWFVHDGPDGWPPISPSHPKTRHLWSTKWLSSCLPGRFRAISTLQGRWALQNADSSYQDQTYQVLAWWSFMWAKWYVYAFTVCARICITSVT